jgi:hypothetical protein
MTQAELITQVTSEIKGLSTHFVAADYTNATNDAARETGFAYPVTTDFQILWQKQRAKRHLFFYLLTEQAYKFKFEQINLQHRFDHFRAIIQDMDAEYEKAIEQNPQEFANVSALHMFGTKVDAGFAYDDETGRDITYDDDQLVIFSPLDTD